MYPSTFLSAAEILPLSLHWQMYTTTHLFSISMCSMHANLIAVAAEVESLTTVANSGELMPADLRNATSAWAVKNYSITPELLF
jgi:hypothetical protein